MTNNKEEQEDELCALESIYTSEEFQANESRTGGEFFVFLTLPPNFTVSYKEDTKNGTNIVKIKINHLPPINFRFTNPKNYPSEAKPEFAISCPWLSITKLNKLCKELDRIWEENKGNVILFTWTQFLKEESLEFMRITNNLDLSRRYTIEKKVKERMAQLGGQGTSRDKPKERNPSKSNKKTTPYKVSKDPRIIYSPVSNVYLHKIVIDYNEQRSYHEFLKEIHTCNICFDDKMGENCIQFKPCCHVYCKNCMTDYFTVRINEGLFHTMPCPSFKCESEANQKQIKELVGPTLYLKYDSLLLNATLDNMDDITYCPRIFCGCPVMRENEDDTIGVCPSCKYSFCTLCKMTYHGVEPCRMKNDEKKALIERYEIGDAATKAALEKRYGKKQILSWIEMLRSEDWILANSKKCPKCNTSIEKTAGCHKMDCSKCHTQFCWLCLQVLADTDPYSHFMNPRNYGCFRQLFPNEWEEEEDDEEEEGWVLDILNIDEDEIIDLEIDDEGNFFVI